MAIQKFNAVDGFSTGLTMTNVIDSGGNISGVAGTFTGILTGATASFSKLLTLNGGLSASHLLVGLGGATFSGNIFAPNIVNSVNGITAGVSITAGTNITLTQSANIITIAASSGGASTNSTTQTLNFSENNNGLEIVFYGLGGDYFTQLQNIENYTLSNINLSLNSLGGYNATFTSIKSFYDAINGWSAKLIVKPSFGTANVLNAITAESILADGIAAVYFTSPSNGNNEDYWIDFVSTTLYHQEETYVTKTVTGQAWVAADSYITCNVLGLTTADHTPEDAILEGVKFNINNIVAGTGFDIIGHAPEGTYGKYTVKCLGQ